MKLVVVADPDAAAACAADWVLETATSGRYLLMAVGKSVAGAFERLARSPRCLEGVVVSTVDELHPRPSRELSFAGQLQQMLGSETGALFDLTFDEDDGADEPGIAKESRILAKGISGAVLGLGRNGHLAFNEPGERFDARSRVVELSDMTIEHLGGQRVLGPLRHGITLGLPVLVSSRRILLLVLGDKADALARLVDGPIAESLPATVLRNHPDVTVLTTPHEAAQLSVMPAVRPVFAQDPPRGPESP